MFQLPITSSLPHPRGASLLVTALLALLTSAATASPSWANERADEPATRRASSTETAVRSPVDVNTATAEQLQLLPRIGPVVARRIVEYRSAVGPFRKLEELLNVKGIGRRTLEQLQPFITLSEPPATSDRDARR